jgi:hemerythrin
MSIRARILFSLGIMSLLTVVMCAASWVITVDQQSDGLVINLAGRQRMRVQKLAKDVLSAGHRAKAGLIAAAEAEGLRRRIGDIERIQTLLISGGQYQDGKPFEIPRAGGKAAGLLGEAARQLKEFHVEVDALLGKFDVAAVDKFAASAESAVTAQDKAVDLLQEESSAGDTTMLTILAVGVVASIVIFLIMLFVLRRTITQPLVRLQAFASAVAGGDLTAVAAGDYPPELEQLRQDLTRMVAALRANMAEARDKGVLAEEKTRETQSALETAKEQETRSAELLERMREAAGKARSVSESVMDESSNLLAQTGQVAQGAEHQRDRMMETATSMEEMNATVLEVARNAGSAASSAEEAKRKAETGAEGVRSAVASIEAIRQHILELRESMARLGQQADGIGHIMNVISDIADQTNLLALNAAIEAARAGDAGRGFAVVADEVRKLAEKTMTATKEVGEAVRSIQTQARENIAAVESAAAGIEQSTVAAAESGRFMDEIVGIVEATASQVTSIATASEQQSATSEEINRAVEEVNRIARETAEGMGAATAALRALSDLAEELDETIHRMTGDPIASRRTMPASPRIAPTRSLPAPSRAKSKALPPATRPKSARALPAQTSAPARKSVPADSGGRLVWDDSLSVGIGEIDTQHKALVRMIGDLHEAMRAGKGKHQIEPILKGLEEYAVEHFGFEESLLEKHKYPGYLNHRKEHDAFVQKVMDFGEQFRADKVALTNEVMDFLKNWLVGHIKGIDKKYGPYLNERGVQ